jgi:hypothetical protein
MQFHNERYDSTSHYELQRTTQNERYSTHQHKQMRYETHQLFETDERTEEAATNHYEYRVGVELTLLHREC